MQSECRTVPWQCLEVRSKSVSYSCELLDGGCGFQINTLPLTSHDSLANLLRSFLLFGHQVAVVQLLHAGGAVAAVLALEAAVQALVAVSAIAVAIARLLVDDLGDFGG